MAQENKTERQVAENLGISIKTVKKWCDRFIKNRLDGLYDLHRSGAPRKFSVPQRCEVIAIACDQPKNDGFSTYTHWTLGILTKAAAQHVQGPKMSRSSIHRTLQRNDLHPHRYEMWLHSKDPKFREKVNPESVTKI
ncbi:helix-turn-helix domain-containing protein [Heyndrickxia coagulans]|uniref:helix-turn-helix domain-containing protein n=1 Tax=Heyndrickxia coagulans TaxID=1398 RepID=UPI000E4A22F3|nr:helix-turn-helix domain-containing protein [Heyndrickxia coagulans]RGR87665.1 helix-turn-helix domain-containing protein [Heyndrickxia coagulans]RGR98789.1 helix-turn-helix domain-containing protein [Heyndrickxia coagulans]